MDPTLNQNNQVNAGVPVAPVPVPPVNNVAEPVEIPVPNSMPHETAVAAPTASDLTTPVAMADPVVSSPPPQQPVGDVYVPPTGVDQMTGPGATDIFASVDPVNENQVPTTPPLSEPKPINMGNMEPEVSPESLNTEGSKSKGKLFKILIPVVVLIVALIGGGLFYMKSQKTSVVALKSFSDATSGISSQSAALNADISKVAYGSKSDNLAGATKQYDDAVVKFEDATSKLKSDRKALKIVAESFIKELKSYRTTSIALAIDVSRVTGVANDMQTAVKFNEASATDTAALTTELKRVADEYGKYTEKFKELNLANDDAKEYRNTYVVLIGQTQVLLKQVGDAVASGDSAALSTAQSNLGKLILNNSATTKAKEIREKLSYGSGAATRLDAARIALNDEITKIKY